jgi:excisionase family DNA binding protein
LLLAHSTHRNMRPGLSAVDVEKPCCDGQAFRLDEAAEVLGVSTRTLKRRIAAGELPVFVDGRVRRVRAVDLERYVAERVRVRRRSVPQLGIVVARLPREAGCGTRRFLRCPAARSPARRGVS